MTTPHPRDTAHSTPGGALALRVAGVLLGTAALAFPVAAPAAPAASAAEIAPPEERLELQPRPGATFGEPAPPGDDPTATAGVDPATGFAINARTRFLVHPGTGHLIEPETGNLLFVDTLIYTNLRYDAETGLVVQVADEAPVPAPTEAAEMPEPTAAPSVTAAPSPSSPDAAPDTAAPADPEPSAVPTPAAAPGPATAAAGTEGASATPTPARSTADEASSTPSGTAIEAAGQERSSSLAPVALIGAGVLLVALAAVVVRAVLARRRGAHG